jgi:hypothetical protein
MLTQEKEKDDVFFDFFLWGALAVLEKKKRKTCERCGKLEAKSGRHAFGIVAEGPNC